MPGKGFNLTANLVFATPNLGKTVSNIKTALGSITGAVKIETDLTKLGADFQAMLMGRLGRLSVPIIEVDKKKLYYSLAELKEVYG
jgi:hypothetical protein